MGTTPHRWLVVQRIILARRMLETTRLTIAEIARECGFGGADSMRRSFLRVLRVAPGAYRGRFLSGPVGSA